MRIIFVFLTFIGGSANAQSNPFSSIAFRGELGVGGVMESDSFDGFQYGDFRFSLGTGAIGFEAGVFGFVGRRHETYGALTWKPATGGQLSLGFPRPAYDEFARSFFISSLPRLSLDHVFSARSRATYGAMYESEFLPYGVLYSNAAGPVSYAVSAHGVPGTDIAVLGGGFRYLNGFTQLSGAFEVISEAGEVDLSAKATVVQDYGNFSVGLGYFDPSITSGVIEAFATFTPVSQFVVTGVIAASPNGGAPDRYGLSARYAMTEHLSLDMGIAQNAGEDSQFSIMTLWTF